MFESLKRNFYWIERVEDVCKLLGINESDTVIYSEIAKLTGFSLAKVDELKSIPPKKVSLAKKVKLKAEVEVLKAVRGKRYDGLYDNCIRFEEDLDYRKSMFDKYASEIYTPLVKGDGYSRRIEQFFLGPR